MSEALRPAISPELIDSFFAIAIGFAVAGLCASGYRLFGLHFPSFRMLEAGPMAAPLGRRSACSSSPPRSSSCATPCAGAASSAAAANSS